MDKAQVRFSSFYAPGELIARLECIQSALQERIAGCADSESSPKLSRSYVIRVALERGLKAMESELGIPAGGE